MSIPIRFGEARTVQDSESNAKNIGDWDTSSKLI